MSDRPASLKAVPICAPRVGAKGTAGWLFDRVCRSGLACHIQAAVCPHGWPECSSLRCARTAATIPCRARHAAQSSGRSPPPPCVGRATSKGAILAECPLPRTDKVRSRLRLTSGNRPFRQCLERCCAAETSVLRYMPDDQRMFDFRSLSANATPVEVLRLPFRKVIWLQCLAKNSPNQRSHRVRRKSGSENGFWVNRRRGSV
ncbi:hypothetical protein OA50_05018 [Mameliella alba]|uniref:Uncharacterized protein n=1 Tax=Mameliella alba TaxID=561184 RepID=A0A0B3RRJ0_9RHOB|nr:hypothetical protein OA50_05018 [Mameliella alba]